MKESITSPPQTGTLHITTTPSPLSESPHRTNTISHIVSTSLQLCTSLPHPLIPPPPHRLSTRQHHHGPPAPHPCDESYLLLGRPRQ